METSPDRRGTSPVLKGDPVLMENSPDPRRVQVLLGTGPGGGPVLRGVQVLRWVRVLLGVLLLTRIVPLDAARILSGQTLCPPPPSRGPCYKIAYFRDVSSRLAFGEAEQACRTEGGALLSIQTPQEQRHVEGLLEALRSGAGGGISDGDFWIGLSRDPQSPEPTSCPQRYGWTDGSAGAFRNWYLDEPSCGGEACVVMYHQPAAQPGVGGAYLYRWNDDRCNMKHNFICKYQPENLLTEEHGHTAGGRDSAVTAGGGVATEPAGDPPGVVMAASGTLLLYVLVPTLPLLLLILAASGSCCAQVFSRRPRTKTAADQANLWIPSTPAPGAMQV
ncbi:chondrolectin [Menidia menidia]